MVFTKQQAERVADSLLAGAGGANFDQDPPCG